MRVGEYNTCSGQRSIEQSLVGMAAARVRHFILIKGLLYARHWARFWESAENKTGEQSRKEEENE